MKRWVTRLQSTSPRNLQAEETEPASCKEVRNEPVGNTHDRARSHIESFSTASKLHTTQGKGAVRNEAHPPSYDGGVTYTILKTPDREYLGWSRETDANIQEKSGELRWRKKGTDTWHHYYGEFHAGTRHGKGLHLMPNGEQVSGLFIKGCPPHNAVLRDSDGFFFDVVYGGDVTLEDGAQPISKTPTTEPVKLLHYCKYGGAVPAIPLSIGPGLPLPGSHLLVGHHPNMPTNMRVTAELVWARPICAQVPLWNANAVNGKIVAIMRGPAPPAAGVGYAMKLHHAQLAGAKAVIFVNFEGGQDTFDTMPAVLPLPDGTVVEPKIPTGYILNQHANFLQEGILHSMVFYEKQTDGGRGSIHPVRAEVQIPVQERAARLSKETASELMADFLAARRKEKQDMLDPNFILPGTPEAVRNARREEEAKLFGINPGIFEMFRSSGPADSEKQVLDDLFGKVSDLASAVSTLITATPRGQDANGVRVWSLKGQTPFTVNFLDAEGSIPFQLQCDERICMNSVEFVGDDIFGKWGEEDCLGCHVPEIVACKVSVDEQGFHVSLEGHNVHCFCHRLRRMSLEKVEPDPAMGNMVEIVELKEADAELRATCAASQPFPSRAGQGPSHQNASTRLEATEAAPAPSEAPSATSKLARWKMRVAEGPPVGAGEMAGAEAEGRGRGGVAAATGAAAHEPVSKAERWQLRASANVAPPQPPAPSTASADAEACFCTTPGCRFMRNNNPGYREAKDKEWHGFCCVACAHSRGSQHGPWCQQVERPDACEGQGAKGAQTEMATTHQLTWLDQQQLMHDQLSMQRHAASEGAAGAGGESGSASSARFTIDCP